MMREMGREKERQTDRQIDRISKEYEEDKINVCVCVCVQRMNLVRKRLGKRFVCESVCAWTHQLERERDNERESVHVVASV